MFNTAVSPWLSKMSSSKIRSSSSSYIFFTTLARICAWKMKIVSKFWRSLHRELCDDFPVTSDSLKFGFDLQSEASICELSQDNVSIANFVVWWYWGKMKIFYIHNQTFWIFILTDWLQSLITTLPYWPRDPSLSSRWPGYINLILSSARTSDQSRNLEMTNMKRPRQWLSGVHSIWNQN